MRVDDPALAAQLLSSGFARGSSDSESSFRALLSDLGEVIQVTDVTVRPESRALVTSTKALDLHTDHHRAEAIGWYCIAQSDEGGHSLVADGRRVFESLAPGARDALQRVRLFEHRVFDDDPDTHPLVVVRDGRPRLYYSYWLVREPLGEPETRALADFRAALRAAPREQFRLAPGEWLVVANRRAFHGRTEIRGNARRLLRRFWVACRDGVQVD